MVLETKALVVYKNNQPKWTEHKKQADEKQNEQTNTFTDKLTKNLRICVEYVRLKNCGPSYIATRRL